MEAKDRQLKSGKDPKVCQSPANAKPADRTAHKSGHRARRYRYIIKLIII
jgi:hypothetical protein